MAIDPSTPPQAAVTAVDKAIAERAAYSAFATFNLRDADVRTLARSTPHRVFYLPFDRIRRGNNLRDVTRPSGWRFLIHGPAEAIAAARMAAEEPDKYVLAELSEGALVTGTEEAIRFAEGLEQVRNGHFEAVLLMVPELYLAALWLRNLDGSSDLVLTIPTAGSALEPDQLVESAAFLDTLSGVADEVWRRLRR